MTTPPGSTPAGETWTFERWLTDSDTSTALKSMLTSEPRAATVLAGSHIDYLLARLIDQRVGSRPDRDQMASASELDYSTKCTSVREMGLISERMLAELRALGRIRNEFAHNPSPDLNFDSAELSAAVERLRSPLQVAADREIPGAGPGVQEALQRILPLSVEGRRYWWTVSVLSVMAILAARLHVVSQQPRPSP